MDRRLCRMREAARQREATRGFGLLEVMLMLLVLGAAVAGGFLYMKATEASREAAVQQQLLAQADRYLVGFAAKNYRLPCPDSNNNGVEDGGECAAGAVGALPFRTLGLEGTDVQRRLGQFTYSVGTAANLTAAGDYYNPANWEGDAYAFGAINGADFCATLAAGVAPAYTLSAASTLNTSDQASAAQTLSRRTDELSVSTGCALLNMSLETLARAKDMVDEVEQQKEDTVQAAIISSTMNGIATILTIVNVVMGAMDMAAAVAVLATAIGVLSAAIAACVVLVGCAEIPHAAATVAAASIAVALAGVSIGLNVASAISQAVATGLALAVLVKANGLTGDSTVDLTAAIAQADATAADAAAKATQREAEAVTARTAATNAQTALATTWTNLLNSAHAYVAEANAATNPVGTRATTMNDSLLVTVQTRANALELAKQAVVQAQTDLEVATTKRDELVRGRNDIQTQLASATDPQKITQLNSALTSMNSQITTANSDVTAAQATLVSRQSAQTSAATALTTAENAAVEAFCFDKVSGACTVTDRRNDMLFAVDYSFTLFGTLYEYGYVPEYRKWFDLDQRAQRAEQTALDARATATDTANRAAQLRTISAGGASSGSELGLWNGAEAILRAADGKGAMQ